MSRVKLAVLIFLATAFCLVFTACSPFSAEPLPGPDKQAVGTWYGAAVGAGSGAIIAAQATAPTGPGAWIGGAFGAIFGGLKGLGIDLLEEDELRRLEEEKRVREIAWVHEVLSEHYARRMELHPSRDIFPADIFFESDSSELRPEAEILVGELAHLTRRRMPWSRIIVAAYSTTDDGSSAYARHVTRERASAIATEFVRAGMEPRRVITRPLLVQEPVLVDPDDYPGRYRQAIEIIPIDK